MNALPPVIKVLGLNIDLSAIGMVTLTCIVVFIIARLATRNLSVDNPGKMQNFLEWVIDFVKGIIGNSMDMKKGKMFIALAMTLIMFIFVGNMLGLPLSVITKHEVPPTVFGQELAISSEEFVAEGYGADNNLSVLWYRSPTADPAITMGLALMMIVLSHYYGITRNTRGYFKGFVQPYAVFLPINIIGEVSKLLTLGMRLFGNIFAGEVMISTFVMAGVFSILGMVPWMAFSIFVGAIQAFIFTMLSMVYMSQQIGGQDNN